jgi:molybdopterin/thiamine biosynthesis adenylyltransferase
MPDYFLTQRLIGDFEPKFTPEIFDKTILIVGLGGNGTHLALAAVRMGFKKIVGIDKDIVSESNLSRQVLYTKQDIGNSKAEVATRSLLAHNLHSEIETHHFDILLDRQRLGSLVEAADFVFVVLDQPGVTFFAIDTCYHYNKPTASGGTCTMSGLVTRFGWMEPGKSPCLNCSTPNHSSMKAWFDFYKYDAGEQKNKTEAADKIDARISLSGGHPSMYLTACMGSNLMMSIAVNYFMGNLDMPRMMELSILGFKIVEVESLKNQHCGTCSSIEPRVLLC